jgi:hypothetical protein
MVLIPACFHENQGRNIIISYLIYAEQRLSMVCAELVFGAIFYKINYAAPPLKNAV